MQLISCGHPEHLLANLLESSGVLASKGRPRTYCFNSHHTASTPWYAICSSLFEMTEVKGGSSYGAGTYAADETRQPTELELQQAFHQGKYVAGIAKRLKC